MEETDTRSIQCIASTDQAYPQRLAVLAGMPRELCYIGRLPREDLPTVGIVGARVCSTYGRNQAYTFARVLSEAGIQVISGMAMGIDAAAHEGALKGGTATFAVLGCGVDVCYPRGNRKLYEQLCQKGGILSEFPPGTEALAWHFPVRNRIISALSDILLVVEAREKSGSLITVDHALEQGKTVYAVPGDVNARLSLGCHKLIAQGAGIAYSPEVLLSHWDLFPKRNMSKWKKRNLGLASELELVYSCLDLRPKNVDILMEKTGFSPGKIRSLLMELELSGLIEEVGKDHYVIL